MRSKTGADRYRRRGIVLAVGALTVGSVVIVGCSGAIEGVPKSNAVQVADYQAEVTSSVAAASSSKAAAEAAETTFEICEEVLIRSGEDVSAFNDFIDANNNGASDLTSKTVVAVSSADELAGWLDGASVELSGDLSGLFVNLAGNLRSTARVIERDHSADEINSIIDTTNSIRELIRNECGAP